MSGPYAKVLADSLSEEGHRLTTMEIRCHRFVLAEFNTHRSFSRNSASSRAIPVTKQLKQVVDNPAIPLVFPMEQRGMQGGDEIDEAAQTKARDVWLGARDCARDAAGDLAFEHLVHKSVANRLLEPFMWHTIIVTATDWDNFFEQRCSPLAQPEIRAVAELMRDAYNASSAQILKEGAWNQWHLPFIEEEDYAAILDNLAFNKDIFNNVVEQAKRISVARCARVSYLTHDGKRDIQQDLALYEKLVEADPPHWSPLEHVATPWAKNVEQAFDLNFWRGNVKYTYRTRRPRLGNLTGWRSLRTEFESEPESSR